MNIIGHEHIRSSLGRRAGQKTRAQAYLFYGPPGVGKKLCALEFAATLADHPDFSPSEALPHPLDVHIVRPEESVTRGITKQRKISALVMRQALSFLSSYPLAGGSRVLIVDQADMLSDTAANVLLKTLEEPNSTAVIILIASHKGSLPSTVLSRMEKIRFSLVEAEVLREAFALRFRGEKDQALVSFLFSLGRPGLLLQALADRTFLSETRENLGKLFRLSELSSAERLALAEALSGDVIKTSQTLEWWLPGLHILAAKNTENSGKGRFFLHLEKVQETLTLLRTSPANARLLLEKLFLTLP